MPSRMGAGGRHRWIHAEAFPRQREMTGRLIGENPKTLAYEATYVRDGVRSGVTQVSMARGRKEMPAA